MQFVYANGVALHYQVFGAAEDRPVMVFVNSLGTDFRIWRDVIVKLAGEYSFVTYDKRGHGLSDATPAPYSMDDHVADLVALLEHLKVRDAIVCGLSVGGLIAQGLYAARPDMVRALVLCDTGHKIGTDELWNSRISAVSQDGVKAISGGILERWFTAHFRRADNPDFHGYRNMLERTTIDGYTGTSAAIRDCDFTAACAKVKVPAICVVGEQDGSTPPALMAETAALIPGARYEVIADAGHLPCIEQPDALAKIIRTFVREAGVDGPPVQAR
ncbi:3-oxoadipate enol-lactonase [Futiania mangrovi]|uniref:3-oxoadipate enol-lactonase n=1 Tax=Futiania mangrovi TaxID=2959716 RepID=A0A9J6PDA9_9PROT|nr:3-oxoadipate enol-lactonase [Futiania mangrovii]MCP1337373.1 3-oxoadipate enol-lactonase [Futiania mangrovii]